MRFTYVAATALTAVSIAQLPSNATAIPIAAPTADVMIQTDADAIAIPAQKTIASPETLAQVPEFLAPTPQATPTIQPAADRSDVPQSIAKPVLVAVNSVPQPIQELTPQPVVQPTIKPVIKPIVKSIIQPIVTPIADPQVQTVAKLDAKSIAKASVKPVLKPTTLVLPKTLPESIATPTTDVKILGVDPELKAIAQQVILTQTGKMTNGITIREDVAAVLETGLFSQAAANPTMNAKGVDVVFNLSPVIARSIQLVDAKILTQNTATQLFASQLNHAVQPSKLNQGVRDVQKWYDDQGYTLARVVGLTSTKEGVMKVTVAEGNISDIKIRFIDETGQTQDANGKTITGRTQDSYIRESIGLKPGAAFKESVAQEDLNRLVRTGLFGGGRVSLEGDLRNAIVVYNLLEQPLRRTNLGGGYSSDTGLYGNVSYSDFNFGGVGQQLGGNVIVGTKDFQFDGRFANPYREAKPDTWGYSLQGARNRGLSRVFDGDIKLATGEDVREGRFGGGITFNKPIAPNWNANLGVNYTRQSARDAAGNLVQTDAAGNPLSKSGTGLDDLYSATASLSSDRRDSALDPKSGSLISLSTEQYVPLGVGNLFANRLSANYSQYVPVNLFGKKDGKNQDVLAFNVQGGTTLGDLPPSQAYLLGGVNSVRGFEQGKVGIGKSYALASAEYRFPILNETVGGTLFADYGTDLGSSASVLGAPGIQRGRSGSGFGYGAGLRVKVPVVGMLRADWGFNDRGENRVQFGVGQKF